MYATPKSTRRAAAAIRRRSIRRSIRRPGAVPILDLNIVPPSPNPPSTLLYAPWPPADAEIPSTTPGSTLLDMPDEILLLFFQDIPKAALWVYAFTHSRFRGIVNYLLEPYFERYARQYLLCPTSPGLLSDALPPNHTPIRNILRTPSTCPGVISTTPMFLLDMPINKEVGVYHMFEMRVVCRSCSTELCWASTFTHFCYSCEMAHIYETTPVTVVLASANGIETESPTREIVAAEYLFVSYRWPDFYLAKNMYTAAGDEIVKELVNDGQDTIFHHPPYPSFTALSHSYFEFLEAREVAGVTLDDVEAWLHLIDNPQLRAAERRRHQCPRFFCNCKQKHIAGARSSFRKSYGPTMPCFNVRARWQRWDYYIEDREIPGASNTITSHFIDLTGLGEE